MDFINIIGTLYDISIEHIVALAHQIKDLRLNKNQQDINEEIYNKLSQSELQSEQLSNTITNLNEINQENSNKLNNHDQQFEQISQDTTNINNRLDSLINENREINRILNEIKTNQFRHIILTQSQYDKLQSYQKNTVYLIVEKENNTYSVFGDTFPFILGRAFSRFGDSFPLTLK